VTEDFVRDGFAVVPGVLGPAEVSELIEAVSALGPGSSPSALDRHGRVYASRNLLHDAPRVRELAGSPALLSLVEPLIGRGAFAVRVLLLDKFPGVNWMVPWHQDLTIVVRARTDTPGFGPWTVKAGVTHVQPPAGVLEGMVTVRLHLDDCGADTGPLRVIPGSHRSGRLGAAETRAWLERVPPVTCLVPTGGAVLLRPLLLHASASSESGGHRRVIHLEYAAHPLPDGLAWYDGPETPAEDPPPLVADRVEGHTP
jgi:hypothetical protein